MFDRLKYLLIEYVHLLFPMVIILGLYINNMPINFRFEVLINKLLSFLTGPGGEFNIETARNLGIEDPDSKAYKIVSYLYTIFKASLSPSYKTMLFKIILIIFLIGIICEVKYTNIFVFSFIFISCLSGCFYAMFLFIDLYHHYFGKKEDKDKDDKDNTDNEGFMTTIYNWLHTNVDSIQVDDWKLAIVNCLIAGHIMFAIFLILHFILNNNDSDSPALQEMVVELKKFPSFVTISMVILISILYLRLDGFTYLCVDVAKYIKYNVILWGNNMFNGWNPAFWQWNLRTYGQWIYFVIYLSIFFMIIVIQYGKTIGKTIDGKDEIRRTVGNLNITEVFTSAKFGELLDAVAKKIPGLGDMKINDISIFNNLIQHTNHPIVVLVFYVYYFLLRTEYGFGWIFNFMLLTCGDIAFKAGLAKKFADEAASNVASKMQGDMPDISKITVGLDKGKLPKGL